VTAGLGGDPLALAGRVLEQVVAQLAPADAAPGGADTAPDELLTTVLANRVARFLGGGEPEDASGEPVDGASAWLPHYEQLVERNSDVAAALGACDCWGEHAECPICDGAGAPGWALPDESLFATYVRPAIAVAPPPPTARRAATKSTSTTNEKEQDDARDLA
jgi:hypothetical protein